jgi:hypothetical protein
MTRRLKQCADVLPRYSLINAFAKWKEKIAYEMFSTESSSFIWKTFSKRGLRLAVCSQVIEALVFVSLEAPTAQPPGQVKS